MGEWASGRVGEWASGRVGEWASGRVGEWASGRVGEWRERGVRVAAAMGKRFPYRAELARKRGELVEQKAVVRYVAYAYTCIKERLRALPGAATNKLNIPNADKHAAKMAIDTKIREALKELADNLSMSVREYQKRVERA